MAALGRLAISLKKFKKTDEKPNEMREEFYSKSRNLWKVSLKTMHAPCAKKARKNI